MRDSNPRWTDDPDPARDRSAPLAPPPAPAPASAESPVPSAPLTEDRIRAALRRVKDPELNLNVIDLGLIYEVEVDGPAVRVDMSLTSPGCPSGPEIMSGVEEQLRSLDGVKSVAVNLVWTPMWSPERIEPRIRAYLGL